MDKTEITQAVQVDLSRIQSFSDLYNLMMCLGVHIYVDPNHPHFENVKHLVKHEKHTES